MFIPLFNALALALVFHLLVTLLRRKGLATLALILMMMAVLAPSDLVELPFSLIFAGLLVLPVVRFVCGFFDKLAQSTPCGAT